MKVTSRQLQCRGLFEGLGYPVSGASAPVGNFVREVGPELPCAFRAGRLDHGSQGLAQWRLDRLTNYEGFVHQRIAAKGGEFAKVRDSMEAQVAFVDFELRTDYPKLHAKLMAGGDVAALAADFCWQFERPSKSLSGIEIRIAAAKAIAADGTAATKAAGISTSTLNPLGLVDHLQTEATTRQAQATGGALGAGVLGVGGVLTGLSAATGALPTWVWFAAVACAIGVVACAWATHVAADHARNLRQAIGNVTPDAPRADAVEHAVVAPPVDPTPEPVDPKSMFNEDVAAEVRRQLAAMGLLTPAGMAGMGTLASQQAADPLHPSNAGRTWVDEAKADAAESGRSSVVGSDAEMTIVRSKP